MRLRSILLVVVFVCVLALSINSLVSYLSHGPVIYSEGEITIDHGKFRMNEGDVKGSYRDEYVSFALPSGWSGRVKVIDSCKTLFAWNSTEDLCAGPTRLHSLDDALNELEDVISKNATNIDDHPAYIIKTKTKDPKNPFIYTTYIYIKTDDIIYQIVYSSKTEEPEGLKQILRTLKVKK